MKLGAGFGLLSLLIVVTIILYLFAGKGGCYGQSYLGTLAKIKKEKEPMAQQWGGKDVRGRPFWETVTLDNWPGQGPVKGLLVSSVDPSGPAATYFGLQTGDIILEIGMQDVGGPIIEDASAGGDFLTEAYARNFPIKVRRGGQELVLPDPNAAPANSGQSPANPPANNPGTGLPNLPGGLVPGGS